MPAVLGGRRGMESELGLSASGHLDGQAPQKPA
jgi:hypothetical protein